MALIDSIASPSYPLDSSIQRAELAACEYFSELLGFYAENGAVFTAGRASTRWSFMLIPSYHQFIRAQ
jgi:hypothetical protein